MIFGLGKVGGGFCAKQTLNIQTKPNNIFSQNLLFTCLLAANEVFVNVWPGFVGWEGISPTGLTIGVKLWCWAMNCSMKVRFLKHL